MVPAGCTQLTTQTMLLSSLIPCSHLGPGPGPGRGPGPVPGPGVARAGEPGVGSALGWAIHDPARSRRPALLRVPSSPDPILYPLRPPPRPPRPAVLLPARQAVASIHLSSCPALSSPRELACAGWMAWLMCTSPGPGRAIAGPSVSSLSGECAGSHPARPDPKGTCGAAGLARLPLPARRPASPSARGELHVPAIAPREYGEEGEGALSSASEAKSGSTEADRAAHLLGFSPLKGR